MARRVPGPVTQCKPIDRRMREAGGTLGGRQSRRTPRPNRATYTGLATRPSRQAASFPPALNRRYVLITNHHRSNIPELLPNALQQLVERLMRFVYVCPRFYRLKSRGQLSLSLGRGDGGSTLYYEVTMKVTAVKTSPAASIFPSADMVPITA